MDEFSELMEPAWPAAFAPGGEIADRSLDATPLGAALEGVPSEVWIFLVAAGSADGGGCFFDLNRKDMVAADFCDLAVVEACDSLIRSRFSISVQPHSSEISCRSRPPHNSCASTVV